MKNRILHTYRNLSYVRLYLEDINRIIEILQEGSIKDIYIETKTKEYTVNELESISESELVEFKICSDEPYLTIEMSLNPSGSGVRIYASKDSTQMRGIISKLEDVFKLRKRLFFSILHRALLILAAISCFFAGVVLALILKRGYTYVVMFIIFLVIPIFLVILEHYISKKKNIIILKPKSECPGFWKRHGHKISIGIIVVVVGGVILNYILKHLL